MNILAANNLKTNDVIFLLGFLVFALVFAAMIMFYDYKKGGKP